MKAIVASVALVALSLSTGPMAAQQQMTGTGEFCVKGTAGPPKCEYQTMAQCQQARPQGSSDQCVARSQAHGTVGGPTQQREQPNAPGQQKD